MNDHRIKTHPVLPPLSDPEIEFTFDGQPLMARRGEVISSALYAAGIAVFGHHHKDGGAQGVFCVNGQCSQCTVVADGTRIPSCSYHIAIPQSLVQVAVHCLPLSVSTFVSPAQG